MKTLIVNCLNRDGFKNVLLMMKNDDFRLTDPRFQHNYQPITKGRFIKKQRQFIGTNGQTYQVYADWSVKSLAIDTPPNV